MKKETFGHNQEEKIKKEGPSTKDAITDLRTGVGFVRKNPIFAYLSKFDEYFKTQKKKLEMGEVLFSPGIDKNMYIIISGGLDILSYTSDGQKKEVGKARAGSFIGEGIIFGKFQKDVEAKADSATEVFALTMTDLKKFEKESPQEAMDLYKYIIEVTNKRLLNSGVELANIYEATNKLVEMSENGEKGFFDTMVYIQGLLGVDYLIYIENHQAIDGLFVYKYNTRVTIFGPVNQKAGKEITSNMKGKIGNNMGILGVHPQDSAYIIPLKYNNKLKGYFIAGKTKGAITDNEMRISSNIGPLIGSIIENNQKQNDKKAKEMSKNYFDNGLNSI